MIFNLYDPVYVPFNKDKSYLIWLEGDTPALHGLYGKFICYDYIKNSCIVMFSEHGINHNLWEARHKNKEILNQYISSSAIIQHLFWRVWPGHLKLAK